MTIAGNSLEQTAHRLTLQHFGKTIQMFAPLYLSNECVDTCLYCGFRRTNKIPRQTLTVEETLKEASFLHQQGFRHILLVAGEHPKQVTGPFLETIAKELKKQWASIGIEVAPLEESEYQKLSEAGVDRVVFYQETYNKTIYESVHVAGPKKDYEKRKQHAEILCRARIRSVGLGILLGLSPWEEECETLIGHIRYLRKKYWRTQFTIGLPRLKPSASSFSPKHTVSDETLAIMICRLRVALPEVGIVLSTREPAELRERLLPLGITHMSAGSKTNPGGYQLQFNSLEQFSISDLRPPSVVADRLYNLGYEPVWKNEEIV